MRWLLALILTLAALPAAACGRDSACAVPLGSYRVAVPEGGAKGVILFFHGYGATAQAAMAGHLADTALAQGLAVIAPQGRENSWAFTGAPRDGRDEMAFLDQVMADVEARFDLPLDRVLVTGFSIGGTMAWEAACYRGARFAGFAPIAGAYWEPEPASCPSPPPVLIHVHGTADTVVPMAGRPIGEAHQGDVRASIAQWRRQAACGGATRTLSTTGLTCTRWTGCESGLVELCLHDGGHSIRTEWVMRGWDQLAALKGWE